MIELSSASLILANQKDKIPIDLTRISLKKDSEKWSIHYSNELKLKESLAKLQLVFTYEFSNEAKILSNGFQTWTESKWFLASEKIENLSKRSYPIWRFFQMKQYGDYREDHYAEPQLHSYHYTAIKTSEDILFIGSLNDATGHTVFTFQTTANQIILTKEIQTESSIQVELFLKKQQSFIALFDQYISLACQSKLPAQQVTGWTSWYHHYTKIDEKIITNNLERFTKKNIPIDIFQIDDGWQVRTGDWTINKKFPNGLRPIVEQANKHGIKSGLWMAPFICEKKSSIYKNHNDWIRRDKNGRLVRAGFSLDWSGNFYVLEWRKPAVKAYLKECFDRILFDWGFDLMKLDFLYAVTLGLTKHTKGQEMYDAMVWLKNIFGDKEILACGVPLYACFGQVAYCRISSDVALKWEDNLLANHIKYRERVSTVNALRSTINRSVLNNKAFLNDPDVFILRNENNSLTKEQKNTLYLVNQALGGLLFTSDDLLTYSDEQQQLYLKQFPLRPKTVKDLNVYDDVGWFNLSNRDLEYLLVYNLKDTDEKVDIPVGHWMDENGFHQKELILKKFESKIYLKRSIVDEVQLVYSNGHIFPGMEIDELVQHDESLQLNFNAKLRLKKVEVFIEIPKQFNSFKVNGKIIVAEEWNGLKVIRYSHKN